MKAVYDHYFQYEEITRMLQEWAEEFPEYTRLSSIGTTNEGREIWLIEITDLSSGDFEDKPGFAVTANIHAGEVTGNCCAMYFLDTLFSRIGEPEISELLKKNTVYCIPRISPDGSELYLTTPVQLRSVPVRYPFEEKMPGLQAEDMDGDGVIRQMRIRDPLGAFKTDAEDPRIMVKRLPWETEGDFYHVYSEGCVENYDPDEEIRTAPAVYGNDLNRNFPLSWGTENRQSGAGSYALSNTETAAIAKFLSDHKNLCTVLHFHTAGGQYLYPPGYQSAKLADQQDMRIYREIGKMATEETGYPCWNVRDEYTGLLANEILGLMDDFCYGAMGLINYTCECWNLDYRAGFDYICPNREKTDDELLDQLKKRLRWIDEHNEGNGYKNWEVFEHPQLGTVEIGGIDYKSVIQNAPSSYILQEVQKHTSFLLREMKTLPHLSWENISVSPLNENAWKLEMTLVNDGYLPTYVTKEAIKLKRAEEVHVTLAGCDVLHGKKETCIGHLNGRFGAGMIRESGPMTVKHEQTEKKLTWIISGKEGDSVTVSASCPRAGKAEQVILLKK